MSEDVKIHINNWMEQSRNFIQLNPNNAEIEELKKIFADAEKDLLIFSGELTQEQISTLQNRPWYQTNSIEQMISTHPKSKKKKTEQVPICSNCDTKMAKTGMQYKCEVCGASLSYYEKTNPISMSSKTRHERGSEEFPIWIKCIWGIASLPPNVENKNSELEEDIFAEFAIKLGNSRLIKLPYDQKRKVCLEVFEKHKNTVGLLLPDKTMREIFKKNNLQLYYKFCNTVMFRTFRYTPKLSLSTDDEEQLRKVYEHVLKCYDDDRKNNYIKSNRYAPSVIKCLMSTLNLDKKYSDIYQLIPTKSTKTDKEIYNLIDVYIKSYEILPH